MTADFLKRKYFLIINTKINTINANKQKGFLKGILLGISYYLLSFIIFSILQGTISLQMSNIYDFILTTLMSGLIGIIVVNIKK